MKKTIHKLNSFFTKKIGKKIFLPIILVSFFISSCNHKPKPETTDTKSTELPMEGTLSLVKNIVEPGEEITVNYTTKNALDRSWIGLIPSNIQHGSEVTNDDNDVDFKYIEQNLSVGSALFVAPADTGNYDFRMNDRNEGKEIATVSFKVSGTPNTITELNVAKTSFAKSEAMTVDFKALVTWDKQAWVAIVPASTAHGSAEEADKVDVAYEYLNKRSKGTIKFTTPSTGGNYSIRMYDAYHGKEVTAVDILVQ